MIYLDPLDTVGNTPLVRLEVDDFDSLEVYAKLEYMNPMGSVKDRAASYIIQKGLENGIINNQTTLIESSSGNLGIALAAYAKKYNLKFICVIDPNISPINEMLIRNLNATIIKVMEPDENGGYLINRIRKVKELANSIPNSYWINQYSNPFNAEAYYHTLGNELCNELENINYIFIGVSSGGTITGVSQRIKEKFPGIKVIAVDIVGSVIFGGAPMKRYIPGIGSSMVPEIIKKAKIDEIIMIDEMTTVQMCRELLRKYGIFAGGSSGSVFAALNIYFSQKKQLLKTCNPKVVLIFPDRGERYVNTIYDEKWSNSFADLKNIKKEVV
jgi:2,3-diaminopropionate biosynthesis protein SbnA